MELTHKTVSIFSSELCHQTPAKACTLWAGWHPDRIGQDDLKGHFQLGDSVKTRAVSF